MYRSLMSKVSSTNGLDETMSSRRNGSYPGVTHSSSPPLSVSLSTSFPAASMLNSMEKDKPPPPLSSSRRKTRPPRKAWEWHYRSFLSRIPSSVQKGSNSGNGRQPRWQTAARRAPPSPGVGRSTSDRTSHSPSQHIATTEVSRCISDDLVTTGKTNKVDDLCGDDENDEEPVREYSVRSGKIFADRFKASKQTNKSNDSLEGVRGSHGRSNMHKGILQHTRRQRKKSVGNGEGSVGLDDTMRMGMSKYGMKKSRSLLELSNHAPSSSRSSLRNGEQQQLTTSSEHRRRAIETVEIDDEVEEKEHDSQAPPPLVVVHNGPTMSLQPSSLPTVLDYVRSPTSGASPLLHQQLMAAASSSPNTRHREQRRHFTEFHSSNEYGKDSASPYLGEDTSVHKHSLFLTINHMTDAHRDAVRRNGRVGGGPVGITGSSSVRGGNTMMGGMSSRWNSLHNMAYAQPPAHTAQPYMGEESLRSSAPHELLRSDIHLHHNSLPGNLSMSLPPVHESVAPTTIMTKVHHHHPNLNGRLVLDAVEGVESWDDYRDGQYHLNADERLVGPAVLAMAPLRMLALLRCDDDETSRFPFGRVVLGMATSSVSGADGAYGNWTRASFAVRQNYLLEYDAVDGQWDGRPRGYAHLQYAVVQPHPEFANVLELAVYYSAPTTEGKTRPRKQLLMRVASREERDRWVLVLRAAADLTVKDLYDYDDGTDHDGRGDSLDPLSSSSPNAAHVLGKGRYSTIYAACRRIRDPKRPSDDAVGLEVDGSDSSSASSSASSRRFDCAIKVVPKRVFWDRVRKGRERADTLVREAAVQATLTTAARRDDPEPPCFLRLRSFFETREHMVLESELLDGGTDLFKQVSSRPNGRSPEPEAARVIRDVLRCLELMGRLGVAHRDVKPANVLVCGDAVRLGDYGMAAFASVDGHVRGRCGTPGYVAPEILKAGVNSAYENRVDVFSTGVTLYVLLCGYEPFYGENDEELMEANKRARVEFDGDEWEDVSYQAKDLVQRMMEADPMERISVQDALEHPWIVDHARPLPSPRSHEDLIAATTPMSTTEMDQPACVVC